jgi:hypothetical protein
LHVCRLSVRSDAFDGNSVSPIFSGNAHFGEVNAERLFFCEGETRLALLDLSRLALPRVLVSLELANASRAHAAMSAPPFA